MSIKAILIAIVAMVAAAGCSPILAPQPDKSTFFILSPVSSGVTVNASGPPPVNRDSQLTLGVGPIDFPVYLSRLQVVTRTSPNQIVLAQERRWGEPLDKNFARVFSENLSLLMNTQRIEKYPWPHKTQVDYQIAMDVQRFETSTDGQSQLIARWVIKDGATGKDLYASETVASSPVSTGDAGASAALSNDLATLSREIAARIVYLRAMHNRAVSESRSQATSKLDLR
ncbi:MAG: PqiC family protein [Candidatus Binatus sp.]|uniref:PqiC family protein n=1 Tax=Candidatus Binatus sp. TaxID=2811406 RepID=UPI00271CF2E6|nr:PqiC family protein [Candidatus Binatus sp.]MDO8433629.1 PqiC family protein [Candidatus Binatus sp.]